MEKHMTRISFWQVSRLIFVSFSLYLMGDAFSRWDGFSYYAAFSEFLPSVALALILWSVISVFAAVVFWMLSRTFEWFCNKINIEIGMSHLLLYVFSFLLFGATAWKGKKLIWPYLQTTPQVKITVLVSVILVSAFFGWFFRNKAENWVVNILERITPLVWLSGLLLMVSVPLVSYHAWFKEPEKKMPAGLAGTSETDTKSPNIILVTFDALAARHMSAYGYPKETTPFISKWSENATVFTRAEAGSNFTTPSAASLMTGKRVWTHQTYHIAGAKPVRSNAESLPSVLKDHGYFNIALVVNPFASVQVLGMSSGFDIAPLATEFGKSDSLFGWKFGTVDVLLYRAFGEKIRLHNWILRNDFIFSRLLNLISRNISQTTVPPEIVFNRFLQILNKNAPEPFFAWIHVFPPHDPYLPPEAFISGGASASELRTYKSQEELIENSYEYLFQYQSFPESMQAAVAVIRDHYDDFISYIDKNFEDFIFALNKRKTENTVILLTADHGESFEHGYLTHGGPFLYEQVTHIPLIIKEPGQTKGRAVDTLVEQIDISATVLELAGIPVPSWMEGRSLVPLMREEKFSVRPAFSMNFEENRSRGHQIISGSVAVWEDDYKLIHYFQRRKPMLFNLNEDPDELNDLFGKEPKVAQRLLGLIKENLDRANEKIIK